MLVHRPTELGRLDALLDRVRAGDGGALLLRGAPGIGKTTLLDAFAERCGDDVGVLRARGVETEAELAFSALSDLLAPVLAQRAALPAPQSAALGAALALGPPAPGDRLAVCVATLGLLRAAARLRPLVAIVDDVQWLDAASRECVAYAARRAGGGLAVALAVREPADPVLERAGLPALRLGPLDRRASLELLRHTAPDLAPSVARELAGAAAGNPLALRELPAALGPDERAGIVALERPVAPGGRLQHAFAGRIEELDPLARRALLIAAAHAAGDLPTISAACTAAGTAAARLAAAEGRGLVRLTTGRLAFSHPLIRGAAYHSARPEERRRAHRALARVMEGERRVWHLAAAAVGADETIAAELEQVASGAASRRAFASASAALERAARLSDGAAAAARRLLGAGETAGAAGVPDRALALLEEAADVAGDGALRVRATHLRARIMVWSGSPAEATRLLVGEAERAAVDDPALAAAMLADAANGCTATNDYERAGALAARAVAVLPPGGDAAARAPVLALLGWTLILRGMTPRARAPLDEAARLAEPLDPLGPHWPWLHLLLRARVPLGDHAGARAAGLALCERAREAGALATLGGALTVVADAALRLGDWETAGDAALEAIRVAAETGQDIWHGYALTVYARLAAARGDEAAGRDAAATALGLAETRGIVSGLRFVRGALGFLELSLERVDDAIAQLERTEQLVAGSGLEEPTLVPWAPDLVEAYARAGRRDDARRVLVVLERQAAATETAFARAAAARCRGMLDDDFEAAFASALALAERAALPFERARTQLALGRRLHRARRRAEARERLRDAHAGFEALGADAWGAQAEHELRAAGARRRAALDGQLTPQEQRVAAAVCRGASNREIAAELYLTPKTIAFHLRQIYRKLGVRSRTQLAARLAAADDATAAPRAGPPRSS
jgi:DNA-binding CsgD family transcriptional regulator